METIHLAKHQNNVKIPAWAQIYFDQQAQLSEKTNSLVMNNSPKKQANFKRYKCRKYGNYARECRSIVPNMGNISFLNLGMLLVFRYFVGILLAFECCSNPIISQCWIK